MDNPSFLLMVTGDGSGDCLLNLAQLRAVDQITETSIRLVFSATHTITVNGAGTVREVLALIGRDAKITDGRSIPELIEAVLSQSPSRASLEGQDLGALIHSLLLHRGPRSG